MSINLNQPIHVATYTVTTSIKDVVDTLQAAGVPIEASKVSAQLVNDFVNTLKAIHDDAIESMGDDERFINVMRLVAGNNGFRAGGS